jgi:hypothetical protein
VKKEITEHLDVNNWNAQFSWFNAYPILVNTIYPLLTTHRPFYQSHLLHEKKKKYEKNFYIKLTLFK